MQCARRVRCHAENQHGPPKIISGRHVGNPAAAAASDAKYPLDAAAALLAAAAASGDARYPLDAATALALAAAYRAMYNPLNY